MESVRPDPGALLRGLERMLDCPDPGQRLLVLAPALGAERLVWLDPLGEALALAGKRLSRGGRVAREHSWALTATDRASAVLVGPRPDEPCGARWTVARPLERRCALALRVAEERAAPEPAELLAASRLFVRGWEVPGPPAQGSAGPAAALAHDLRHLVTIAGLELERARVALGGEAEALEALAGIVEEARLLCAAGLVGSDPAAGAGRLGPALERAVRRASELRDAAGRVALVCRDPDEPLRVPEAVVRIVRNLVLNALDASPSDGTVEVEASAFAGSCEIVVRDRGRGLSPDALARLFSGRAPATGEHGHGAHSVLACVEALRGEIEARSRPADGTEVRVRFPRDDGGAASLLVDPDPARRARRASELARSGCPVVASGSAERALALLVGLRCGQVLVARGTPGDALGELRARAQRLAWRWIGAREPVDGAR